MVSSAGGLDGAASKPASKALRFVMLPCVMEGREYRSSPEKEVGQGEGW